MGKLLTVNTFVGIDERALDRIEVRSRQIEYQDGALIFAQSDPADAVYAIIGGEGRVRIGTIERGSKGLMVQMFHAGEIFGEIAVIDGDIRSADAVAEGRVRTLRIGATVFLATLAAGGNFVQVAGRPAAPALHAVPKRHVRGCGG